MVAIAAGEFRSGCDPLQRVGLSACRAPSLPLAVRRVAAFDIDRTEVTIGDYLRCWDAGPCHAISRHLERLHPMDYDDQLRQGPRPIQQELDARFDDEENRPGADHPDARIAIFGVSPSEARVYCAWLGKRLPTDLEWEKAARGTDGRPYPWGGDAPSCERARYFDCHGDRAIDTPHGIAVGRVGSYPRGASPYGVLDMVGNADEYADSSTEPGRAVVVGQSVPAALSVFPSALVLGGRVAAEPLTRLGPAGFRCARSFAR